MSPRPRPEPHHGPATPDNTFEVCREEEVNGRNEVLGRTDGPFTYTRSRGDRGLFGLNVLFIIFFLSFYFFFPLLSSENTFVDMGVLKF